MNPDTIREPRYRRSVRFLKKHFPPPVKILDLGVDNELADLIRNEGYDVTNTGGEDLDLDHNAVLSSSYQLVTAFEILEHLVSPFTLLKAVRAPNLIATVPLRLWFSKAYRNPVNPRDNHFHEFESWQFDLLVNKAGWEIADSEKWTIPSRKIGIRPLLRSFTPRIYTVCCQRPDIIGKNC